MDIIYFRKLVIKTWRRCQTISIYNSR